MTASVIDLIPKRFESLSPSQREVALLLAEGWTNIKIAQHLGVTVHTVKAHRAEAMRRMEADSFADLLNQLQRLSTTQAAPAASRTEPLRIIVIEDDEWYREYLTANLEERGYTAIGVANGTGFQTVSAEAPADIAIIDIELGSSTEDGLAIASRVLAGSACGIIMVTARGELDDRIKGLGIGADAYFSKPVNIDELALTIANLGRRLI